MSAMAAYSNSRSYLRKHITALILAIIVLSGLALRLYFAGTVGTEHNKHYDMARYNNLALRGGVPFSPPAGYPLFLRAVYGVFGRMNYRAVYLIQATISSLTILIMYRVTVRIGSRRAGLIAAGLAAVYPNLIVFNLITLTETIGLLVIMLLFEVLSGNYGDRAKSATAAIILCIGYLFRPALMFFWPGALWCVRRKRIFIGMTAVIILAWISYGAASGQSSRRFARGFYKSYNPAQRGSSALEFEETPLEREDLPSGTYLRNALAFMIHNKWETLDIIYYKAAVLVSRGHSNYTVSKLAMGHRHLSNILMYCYIPVALLGFLGLVKLSNKRCKVLTLPTLSYVVCIILFSIFKARYRLMIEPVLIIFASKYIDDRLSALGRASERSDE